MDVGEDLTSMPFIFVYGTLRRGGNHHHLLSEQRFVGAAASVDKFLIRHASTPEEPEGYPVATPDPAGQHLSGEIYEIDEKTLHILDEYEDYPRLYDRRRFDFNLVNGSIMRALMYCSHTETP